MAEVSQAVASLPRSLLPLGSRPLQIGWHCDPYQYSRGKTQVGGGDSLTTALLPTTTGALCGSGASRRHCRRINLAEADSTTYRFGIRTECTSGEVATSCFASHPLVRTAFESVPLQTGSTTIADRETTSSHA